MPMMERKRLNTAMDIQDGYGEGRVKVSKAGIAPLTNLLHVTVTFSHSIGYKITNFGSGVGKRVYEHKLSSPAITVNLDSGSN